MYILSRYDSCVRSFLETQQTGLFYLKYVKSSEALAERAGMPLAAHYGACCHAVGLVTLTPLTPAPPGQEPIGRRDKRALRRHGELK